MARTARTTFKQQDVTRAAKGVRAAGYEIDRVVITQDGSIVVVPGKPEMPARADQIDENPWDGVVEDATDQKRAS
jgi:hypothetical protein